MTPEEQFPRVTRIVQLLQKGGITDETEIVRVLESIATASSHWTPCPEEPQETP